MKRTAKKIISAVLLLAILISSTNFSAYAVNVNPGDTDVGFTDAQLVSENYSFFNDYEKAILACTALKGNTHTINVPGDSSLVQIDTEAKRVTAADFVDGEYTWKATGGVVKYNNNEGVAQTPVSFAINNTVGFFTCPSDRYTIDVTYELYIDVDEDLQQLLFNASSYLVDGAINFDILYGINGYLSALAENFDSLYSLTTGEISMTFPSGAVASIQLPPDEDATKAIVALHNELVANGGNFTLYNLIESYNNAPSKTLWMVQNGSTVKAEVSHLYDYLFVITGVDSVVRSLAEQARTLGFTSQADGIEKAVDYINKYIVFDLGDVNSDPWKFLSYDIIKTDASAAEYAALDAAVANAIRRQASRVSEHNNETVKNPLKVAQTVISQGVDQYSIKVTVKAQVVDKNSISSKALTTLSETATVSFVFDKGTTKAEILHAIESSGVKAQALAAWDAYYNIGDTYYTVTETGIPESLEADIECSVVYSPKSFNINYNYNGTSTDIVPYGYNLYLEKNADTTKSYDYTVNGKLMREDTVYRVVSDTEVSREEAKAIVKYSIATVIASSTEPGSTLTAEEKAILNSQGLKEEYIWYRTPSQENDLVAVAAGVHTGDYTVSALDYSSGLTSGAVWTAVKGYLVTSDGSEISSFDISNETGSFSYIGDFDHVKVTYQLNMTDVDIDMINKYMNLPHVLATDAAAQKQSLSSLTDTTILNSLSEIYGSRISIIEGLTACKDAVRIISSECIDSSTSKKPLYLYEYIQEYIARGLTYYYEGDNAAKIMRQIDLLRTNLNIIWEDPEFQANLQSDEDIAKYQDKLEIVRDKINAISLVGINDAVDSSSDYIGGLVTAIEFAEGYTSAHSVSSNEITLPANITASTPDKATVEIVVNVINGKGTPIAAAQKGSRSFSIGRTLDSADIALITALESSLESQFTFDKTHYVLSITGPELVSGYILSDMKTTVTYTWAPVSYTAKIDGEADQTFKADGNLSIILPGCPIANFNYIYNIGGEEITVGSADKVYTFSSLAAVDALFGIGGTYTITRSELDVYREETLNFIADLNQAMANGELSFEKDNKDALMVSFIPLEDALTGEISVVLRISPRETSADYMNVVTEVANSIIDTYFDYIGIGNNTFWDGKIHLQSIIDAIVASELGLDTVLNMIDENGNIKQITTDIPALAALEPVGADAEGCIGVNGKYITDIDKLGGKLLGTTLQLGSSSTDSKTLPFYVTIEDFGLQTTVLKDFRGGVSTAKNYVDIKCAGNALNLNISLPNSVYSYYAAGMVATGNMDIENFNVPDFEGDFKYLFDIVEPLIRNNEFNADVIQNTIDKAGSSVDISGNKAIINNAINAIINLLDNTERNTTWSGARYESSWKFDIKTLLIDKLNVSETISKFIAEATSDDPQTAPAGLSLNVNAEFTNMEKEYEAFIIDRSASKTQIVRLVRDIETELPKAAVDSVIILLKDVTFNTPVTLSKSIIIDLNGYTIKGDINSVCKGSYGVTILDSRIDTYACGTVEGALTGLFTITAGFYDTDVSAMLKNGYTQDNNGYVTNKLFVIQEQSNGDINVKVSGDFLNVDNSPALRIFAAELGADLLGNFITAGKAAMDGNVIYDLDMNDLVGYVNKSVNALIGDAVECVDTDGVTAFVKTLLDDLTDFAAVKASIENKTPITEFLIEKYGWDISLPITGTAPSKYVSADIGALESDMTTQNVRILLSEKMTAEERNNLISLLDELDKTVTINKLDVKLNDLSYNGGFKYALDGDVDVAVDLSANPDYAAIAAILVANKATGALKTELIDAIKEYLDCGIASEMRTALNKASSAQFVAALKGTSGTTLQSIMTSLGIESENIVSLEKTYNNLISIGVAVVNKLGISGSTTAKLGSYQKAEYGTYGGSLTRAGIDAKLLLKLFKEDKDIVVRTSSGVVNYTAAEVETALTQRSNGDIIYFNNPAVLTSDVTVSAKLVFNKAANLDLNGHKITLKAPDAAITSDAELGSENLLSDSDIYKIIETTEDGKYIYAFELRPVVVFGADGRFAAEFAADKLAEAIESAADGGTVVVNTRVTLGADVELTASISIANASRINFNGKKITLKTTETKLTTDSDIGADAVVSGLAHYKTDCAEVSGKFVYSLSLHAIIVVHKDNTETKYTADALAAAINACVDGDTVYVYVPSTLTADATITAGVKIVNANNITFAGKHIILKKVSGSTPSLTTDSALPDNTVTSENIYFEVIKSASGTQAVYGLKALTPQITGVNVEVKSDGLIRGAKVDTQNRYIYIDGMPSGLTVQQFSLVSFVYKNTETKTVSIKSGTTVRGQSELVCNGDTITVAAANSAGGSATLTYRIIILGDTNCNGKIDSGDAVRINTHFVGIKQMSDEALLAADTNRNGKIDSGDAVNISTKFTSTWKNNTYVSALNK